MYTVSLLDYDSTYKGELSIYDPFTSDEAFMITEPKLNLTASQAGSFSCTIPVTNRGYGKIINHRTRAIVRKDDKIIFMGRISSSDKDLYLNQKIEAEGALAYLNDSLTGKEILQNKTLAELLIYIFTNHNSKFPDEKWKQFNLTVCEGYFTGRDNSNPNSKLLTLYSVNYYSSMECVTELLNLANAVLKISYNDTTEVWDVYVYPRYNCPVCSQPIEFGTNLVDLVQSYQNDICSAVAPFGGELQEENKEVGEVIAGVTSHYELLTSAPGDWSTNYFNYYIKKINTFTQEEYYEQLTPMAAAPTFEENTYYNLVYDENGIYYHIFLREDDDYDYKIYGSGDPEAWAFEFNIAQYNQDHANNPLKKLYVSWRSIKYSSGGYTCDNAWRLVTRMQGGDQSLGFHELTSTERYESAINEEIDLSDPNYQGVTHIKMGGFGRIIKPTIRRDATVVEEKSNLSIDKCDVIDPTTDADHLSHPANSPYLYSETYLNSYGLIEKKLEYDIEDTVRPSTITHPYSGVLGSSAVYEGHALGYVVCEDLLNPTYDYEKRKGEYYIIPFAGGYNVIEMTLPDLGSPSRPRGLYVSSRMHVFGDMDYAGKGWKIDGMYVFMDSAHKVLSYKSAAADNKGVGFTSIKREYINLSDAEYYGTKYIRIGGYVGDGFPLELLPSDDAYARDNLMTQARFYLTQQQWEKVVIEATAVDLNMVDSDWEKFDICENAEVYSNPHSITATLPISSIEIQLDNYENNTIKLGYDSDEYLSNQLADNLRIMSIEQALDEKRRNST